MIRIHSFIPDTRANGPGRRACIWFQGCTISCNECCNVHITNSEDGENVEIADIVNRILKIEGIEGVSISGGEPFQQCDALFDLLKSIRQKSDLSVLVFTGYDLEEIIGEDSFSRILPMIDILVAGRYDKQKAVGGGLLASANQKIHFLSPRYGPQDLEENIDIEIFIDEEGMITATGVSSPAIFTDD
ncbi:MAG: radical SAM protein [Chloroflexi bacterium]|nr:radical SAM protein [Chloroflexota bacterium]